MECQEDTISQKENQCTPVDFLDTENNISSCMEKIALRLPEITQSQTISYGNKFSMTMPHTPTLGP